MFDGRFKSLFVCQNGRLPYPAPIGTMLPGRLDDREGPPRPAPRHLQRGGQLRIRSARDEWRPPGQHVVQRVGLRRAVGLQLPPPAHPGEEDLRPGLVLGRGGRHAGGAAGARLGGCALRPQLHSRHHAKDLRRPERFGGRAGYVHGGYLDGYVE